MINSVELKLEVESGTVTYALAGHIQSICELL